MALLYLIIALIIQGAFADGNDTEEILDSQEILNKTIEADDMVKDIEESKEDWTDLFVLTDTPLYPTSSVAMMEQATNSEKSIEDQIEDIKEIAEKITLAIQSEMANLLTYALSVTEKESDVEDCEENNLRKKRSAETPMDSSELITRLLKHIKNNNDYQNIAIDKMMTAQEIADKYGIEYRPDTEILSDLAFAANHNAIEMTTMLKDSLDMKNGTYKSESVRPILAEEGINNEPFSLYPENEHESVNHQGRDHVIHNYIQFSESYPRYNYYNYPYETQIPSPVQNYYSPPVSKKPNFYDTLSQDIYPHCSMEPFSPLVPFEDIEPELVGEEFEETISSKVLVDRGEEPGSATVNHVMTYTISEKSHFRTPEIERLPQQMQYCFFLM